MTRSSLLAYLLTSDDRTPDKLTKVFDNEWEEPMHSLIALGVIIPHRLSKNGSIIFYVAGWKGKDDIPLYSAQAVTDPQKTYQAAPGTIHASRNGNRP